MKLKQLSLVMFAAFSIGSTAWSAPARSASSDKNEYLRLVPKSAITVDKARGILARTDELISAAESRRESTATLKAKLAEVLRGVIGATVAGAAQAEVAEADSQKEINLETEVMATSLPDRKSARSFLEALGNHANLSDAVGVTYGMNFFFRDSAFEVEVGALAVVLSSSSDYDHFASMIRDPRAETADRVLGVPKGSIRKALLGPSESDLSTGACAAASSGEPRICLSIVKFEKTEL